MKKIVLSGSKTGDLPEGFPHAKIRSLQKTAIEEISKAWKDGYRYVFLEAPTGFGKSAIAITLARQNHSAFILVSTKTLQEQYVREKKNKTIKVSGRNNFQCIYYGKGKRCDVGACVMGMDCDHRPRRFSEDIPMKYSKVANAGKDELYMLVETDMCHYWDQKCRGLNHGYPVMNYAYFLNETTHAHDFSKRTLMVCDEAHSMEDELMRFIEFRVSDRDLAEINCRIPEGDVTVEEWIANLKEWREKLETEVKYTDESLKKAKDKNESMEKTLKIKDIFKKIEKCEFISKELSDDHDNWIIDNERTGGVGRVIFKPIFVRRWGQKFFGMADRFLLQSATIIDAAAMADSLGLPEDECIFLRSGSEFVAEKRPVHYVPVGRMSRAGIEETLPILVEKIRELMEKYPDQKGVIHTHTYKIQEHIMKNIDSERLIANKSGDSDGRDMVIRRFIHSSRPMVLVTPSAYEGMDFKDDICRWQVICKIPYPDLGDKQVKKRTELSGSWYQWKTILRLVQTYGRGVRSKNDWCDTYIFDSNFQMLLQRNKELFPEWFTEAIVDLK